MQASNAGHDSAAGWTLANPLDWTYLCSGLPDEGAEEIYAHPNVVIAAQFGRACRQLPPALRPFGSVEGMSCGFDAARRGASERLLPILMTALVTALGLLPLAIGSGARAVKSNVRWRSSSSAGSSFRPPLIYSDCDLGAA
jgi:hypothetical protein